MPVLHQCSHAFVSCRNVSIAAMRRSRYCFVRTLSSISAMFNQLPCFGV
jgi:hypothetical protein